MFCFDFGDECIGDDLYEDKDEQFGCGVDNKLCDIVVNGEWFVVREILLNLCYGVEDDECKFKMCCQFVLVDVDLVYKVILNYELVQCFLEFVQDEEFGKFLDIVGVDLFVY